MLKKHYPNGTVALIYVLSIPFSLFQPTPGLDLYKRMSLIPLGVNPSLSCRLILQLSLLIILRDYLIFWFMYLSGPSHFLI